MADRQFRSISIAPLAADYSDVHLITKGGEEVGAVGYKVE